MKDLIGQNLGRYHIVEALGQGGMATVFKAYDTTLERYVAVKIIRTDIEGGGESEFLLRFKREAKALAQLDHPYILKVLDYGEQDGVPYLVMPFVPGGTLKQKMGRAIPCQEAAGLLAPIARALEYAHKQKIVHRDVKPANILVTEDGAPLLSDFGIAKMLTPGGSTQLTATGVGIGTPDYMAPEQWTGQSEPRTDIYSLGIVFYEMVAGHRPFTADTPAAVLIKHLRDPLPHPATFVPDLPDQVVQILFKALDKEPDHRFQNMGAFAFALEKLALGEPTAIAGLSVDLQTVRNPLATMPEAVETAQKPAETRLAEKEKKTDVKKVGFFALATLAGLGILCIVLGGAVWASISLRNRSNATPTAIATATQGESPTAEPSTTSVPPFFPQGSGSETVAPFETIEGFPEDVPILKENNGDLMKSISQGQVMYMFSTNMSFPDVENFYKTGMEKNGWELNNETTQEGQTFWYYMKGQNDQNIRMVMVGITDEKETNTCRIMIYLMSQQ